MRMLTNQQIDTIHRLRFVEKWTVRKIARHLHIGRRTLVKYLIKPAQVRSPRTRTSKLDPFKPAIQEWLQQDASVTAAVIFQRLREEGFAGGCTIVKDHLQAIRTETKVRRAFVRMEPPAGERFESDWGHFGALLYDGAPRKLYAFCLVECHSRKMYLEFTHSQTFETFVRCHIHAFQAMGGVARELWFDNLATVVAEHDGNLVRFNPRFLGFAREYGFVPRACHVAAAWEKGKVERAIGYVRQNFWPLRNLIDLPDINSQAHQWLQQVANQRRHRETGQIPDERFRPECLRPLPAITPDYRDCAEALVHKDLRLSFDGNRYCVAPRYVGRRLTVRADSSSVTIYDQHQEVVRYPRSWRRGQTFGAERFEKELFAQMAAAERSAAQHRVVMWLGPASEEYLRRLANTDRSLSRQVRELLTLIRDYGPDPVAAALAKAHAAGAFGADYVANILRQQQSRRDVQPPLELKDPALNQLATDPLSLAAYDAFILRSRKESCELTTSETGSTQPHDHEPESGPDSD
ncbi:MAG: IS21 family transposase [Acidobacteria bacterium]|nr:IS21 family transposase [Acidobacteriota bacterium]